VVSVRDQMVETSAVRRERRGNERHEKDLLHSKGDRRFERHLRVGNWGGGTMGVSSSTRG